jgi:uncharacterized protein
MDNTSLSLRSEAATFFSLSDTGRNGWWRYILGVIFILVFWLLGGAFVYATVLMLPLDDARQFLALNANLMMLLLGVLIVQVLLHRRPWRTLLTTRQTIDWRRIFQGFAVWGGLILIGTAIESALYPGRYVWSFESQRWIKFFVLASILTPLQCAAEEVFFRGYLLQAMGRLFRSPVIAATLSSILFTVAHLWNPEVAAHGIMLMAPFYFIIGFFFAIVALRDGGLELSLGAHTVNNLFLIVLFSYKESPLPAAPFFTADALDPVFSLVSVFVAGLIFYAWFFYREQRHPQ